jgi:hypothetical protein
MMKDAKSTFPHVTLESDKGLRLCGDGSALSARGNDGTVAFTNVTSSTDPSTFRWRLHYPANDDDDNDDILFHMVMLTKVELDSQLDGEEMILSPGLGNSSTDPDHTNHLQNPISYGPSPKVKQLAMINSKIKWNGKQLSFDELNRLIEGRFEDYGMSHLVNWKFLDVFDQHGYKVLKFFPRVCLKSEDLEKQNGALYWSLKQICQKGAAIIHRHEQKQDGMQTWLDLLV